jgi:serine/threonine protein kinase
LLRELLIIELNYRRDGSNSPLTDAQVCELHPQLMPEIAKQLELLRERNTESTLDANVTRPQVISTVEANPTIELEPRSSSGSRASRGLHIRCPHCSNPVELLTDTRLESITCRTCGSAFSLVDSDDQTRQAPALKRIGRFELVARLGIGGFGTVWKARDTELERTVAVKMPRKGQLAPQEVEQFLREARSAAQLRHPNIVPVHEVGREDDTIFIVSDLIRGVSLSDWLSGATPSPREAASLMAIVAGAVQHAHEKGVIHRDLKPSNILIDETGQPHIMDFGLAKREVGEISMTLDGQVLGTPAYMSPEQAGGHGHWTDRRSDVYSLGVVLFRLLTGELPFRGNAQMQIHRRLSEDPPDPRSLKPTLPRDLCTICLKCLERDPNRRFSTAKELADELWRFDRGEPILSRPISRTERVLRWTKRNPAKSVAAALTLFLAVAGPITAIVIAVQKNRLGELYAEQANLIQQNAVEKARDANTLAELREQLDVWEGRGNPWKLWPPKPKEHPRPILLQEVASQGERLAAPWQQSEDLEERAYGHLALAIIHDELNHSAEAISNYETAQKLLTELAFQNPVATHYVAALADCYRHLGRLRLPTDRTAAAANLEQSGNLTKRLVGELNDPRLRAEWLERELELAALTGGLSSLENLTRTQKIEREFTQNLPQNPLELYELACFLTGREPMLITRKTGNLEK